MPRIAGNQTGNRNSRDDYPTDPTWTRVLTRRIRLPGTIWEPAAGGGEMAKTLEEAGYNVRATDVVTGHDFLTSTDRADTIITNPPYRLLDQFIERGLAQSDEMLCLLVGWHFLAGGARRAQQVWRPAPPSLILAVVERMPVNGAHSQYNHAWAVWDHRQLGRHTAVEWHSARENL